MKFLPTFSFLAIVLACSATEQETCPRGHGRATDCHGKKCNFQSNLELHEDTEIQLTVSHDGPIIVCHHTPTKNKRVWHGDFDGDAQSANFVQRTSHRFGRDHVYGSIHVGNDICTIGTNADDENQIECVSQSEFPEESDPVEDDDDYEAEEAVEHSVNYISL